jgi:Tfp pilus assembly protein FimT
MTKKLMVVFSICALLSLIAAPAMANFIVQVEPTKINSTNVSTSTRSLSLAAGDVVTFQLVGYVTGAGDSGVNGAKGSLAQLLATVTKGTWNTAVKGSISTVTLTDEFKYNYPTTSKSGVVDDINNDGFALDVGSTAAATTNYIIFAHSSITGHGVSGDVLGTFTYTVSQIDTSSTKSTVLNWVFATAGASSGKAIWTESGTAYNSSNSTNYAAGDAISLNAIPEPSTLVMISMGALALLFFRRRKL